LKDPLKRVFAQIKVIEKLFFIDVDTLLDIDNVVIRHLKILSSKRNLPFCLRSFVCSARDQKNKVDFELDSDISETSAADMSLRI
jgi:hypothetical protein